MPVIDVTKEEWEDLQIGKDVILREIKEEYNFEIGAIAVIRQDQQEIRRKIDCVIVNTVENIFKSFNFKQIFPRQLNKLRAIKKAKKIFEDNDVLAIELNKKVENGPQNSSWNNSNLKKLIIHPNQIKGISPYNIRKTCHDERLSDLVESLKAVGINTEPILLDEKMEVISGARRYKAAIEAGLEEVFCHQRTMSIKEKKIRSFTENSNRDPILPKDKFTFVKDLMDNEGMSADDIAKTLGVNKKTIEQWLKYFALPQSLQGDPEGIDRYRGLSKQKSRVMNITLDPTFPEKENSKKTKPRKKITLQFEYSFVRILYKIRSKSDTPGEKLEELLQRVIEEWTNKKSGELGISS